MLANLLCQRVHVMQVISISPYDNQQFASDIQVTHYPPWRHRSLTPSCNALNMDFRDLLFSHIHRNAWSLPVLLSVRSFFVLSPGIETHSLVALSCLSRRAPP